MSHSGKHGYPKTKKIMAVRRAAAEERQKEYQERYPTLEAKLAALPPEPYAKKQRAKLLARLESAKKPSVEKPKEVVETNLQTFESVEDVKMQVKAEIKAKKYNKKDQ